VEYGINSTILRNSWNYVKQSQGKIFLKSLPLFKKTPFRRLQVYDNTLTLRVVDSPTYFTDALNEFPLLMSPSNPDYTTELDLASSELYEDTANVG
jgi:hypothetical protein